METQIKHNSVVFITKSPTATSDINTSKIKAVPASRIMAEATNGVIFLHEPSGISENLHY